MSHDDRDALLFDYLLGSLPPDEHKRLEAQLASDPELGRQLVQVQEALAALAWAEQPLPAPASGRARLIDATRSDVTPSFSFSDKLARFFDLTVNEVRALLAKAASPSAWEAGPMPGMELFHLAAGPRWAGCDAGFIRFSGGTVFPTHTHGGEEHSFMLEGGMTLDDGTELYAGQSLSMDAGSTHSYTVHPKGCVFALILRGGIDIPGVGRLGTRS
jgi:hypothetical protein